MQSSKFPPSVSTLPNVHELTAKHRVQFLIGHVWRYLLIQRVHETFCVLSCPTYFPGSIFQARPIKCSIGKVLHFTTHEKMCSCWNRHAVR